jgi:sugar lactone lactonase YvrE
MCLFAQPVKLWETQAVFREPESIAYDSTRNFIYVSNLTENIKKGYAYGEHYITKATLDGEIIELKWIKNLTTPTGITIYKDRLFVVERFGIVEFDLKGDSIASRYRVTECGFINDICIAPDGSMYITESDGQVIYKIKDRKVTRWLESEKISRPNAILFRDNKLIVGVCSDSSLKSIDLYTKHIETITQFSGGIIDGIKKCGDGFLVSHFEGNLFHVNKFGVINELMNTRNENINIADFEFIESKNLIIVPALRSNKLLGFRYNGCDK